MRASLGTTLRWLPMIWRVDVCSLTPTSREATNDMEVIE